MGLIHCHCLHCVSTLQVRSVCCAFSGLWYVSLGIFSARDPDRGHSRLSINAFFTQAPASTAPTRPLTFPLLRMSNAEGGPSHIPSSPKIAAEASTTADAAPLRPLPSTHFHSIEYPGYVQPTSVPLALERLGGQASVESTFRRTGSKSDAVLELNLRPGNPFAHPIPGEVVPTSNILLKVVKRRRKREESDASEVGEGVGEYTVEALGVIPKTVRFRSEHAFQRVRILKDAF